MFDAPDVPQSVTRDPNAPQWREENHLGALCVFQPLELLPEFSTEYGIKAAMRATITVVDGPGAGARYEDALVFGTVVVGQLREKVGRSVLAKLTQGEKQPGKRPPWKLDGENVTAAETELAVRAMTMLAQQPATAQPTAAVPTPPPAAAVPPPPWATPAA